VRWRLWWGRLTRIVAFGGIACFLLLLGLLRGGLRLGLLRRLLGQQRRHCRIGPRRLRRLRCLRRLLCLRRLRCLWCHRSSGLRRRGGVLLEELRGGRTAVVFGVLEGGAAVVVEQLGVGLGTDQGLHARLVPMVSGSHQGGFAVDVLQVGVGRVLQQDKHDGGVAGDRSVHERGDAEAAWQVDARASLQQLPHHLQLAKGCGGEQQSSGYGPTAGLHTMRHLEPRCQTPCLHLGAGATCGACT
jgi:hypothetical protein